MTKGSSLLSSVLAALMVLGGCRAALADSAVASPAPPSYSLGTNDLSQTLFGGLRVTPLASGGPLALAASTTAEKAHVFATAAAKVYSINVGNVSGAAGLALLFDSATAPADGAVTPLLCIVMASGTSLNLQFQIPFALTSGVVVAFSSGTNCFSQTGVNAFFSAAVQ